ncbi:anthrone oxygenase family protein [Nocardia sp. NPDC056000]|uniref:anthrone oxygenase family protein n=1 Tax=Nocardia sp. NPDC056000 TaxID=3345674 RepID=UPI0035E295BE
MVLELSLRHFNGAVYTQVRQVELDSLDKLAVATLLPALLTTAFLAYRTFQTNTRWLPLTALALLLFVFGLTLVVNLPINADQLDWTIQSPPDDWSNIRNRWQLAHFARTTAAVLAFGLLSLASSLPVRWVRDQAARPATPSGDNRPAIHR